MVKVLGLLYDKFGSTPRLRGQICGLSRVASRSVSVNFILCQFSTTFEALMLTSI